MCAVHVCWYSFERPRKDRQLSELQRERMLHSPYEAGDWTWDLRVGRQRSYHCANPSDPAHQQAAGMAVFTPLLVGFIWLHGWALLSNRAYYEEKKKKLESFVDDFAIDLPGIFADDHTLRVKTCRKILEAKGWVTALTAYKWSKIRRLNGTEISSQITLSSCVISAKDHSKSTRLICHMLTFSVTLKFPPPRFIAFQLWKISNPNSWSLQLCSRSRLTVCLTELHLSDFEIRYWPGQSTCPQLRS